MKNNFSLKEKEKITILAKRIDDVYFERGLDIDNIDVVFHYEDEDIGPQYEHFATIFDYYTNGNNETIVGKTDEGFYLVATINVRRWNTIYTNYFDSYKEAKSDFLKRI